MKFKMSIGGVKIVVISLIVIGALALIALDICLLVGVGALRPAPPVTAGVSMAAAAVIITIALLLLFNCHYKFQDGCLKVTVGFFSDKIFYDDVLALRKYSSNGSVYLIVKDVPRKKRAKQGDVNAASDEEMLCTGVPVNIPTRSIDAFADKLREYIPNIKIENF